MNDLYDASAPGQATELGSQQWDTSASPPATLALARDAQRQLTDLARQADSARDQVLQIFRAIDEHRQAGVPTTFDVATELDDTSDKLLDLMGRIHDACDPYVAWCPADDSPDPDAEDDPDMAIVELSGDTAHRYWALVAEADEAMVGIGPDQTISAWNHAAERLFGWSETEAVGQPLSILVPERDHQEYEQRRDEAFEHGPEERYHSTHVHRDGSRLDLEIVPTVMFTDNGAVAGGVAVCRPLRRAADMA